MQEFTNLTRLKTIKRDEGERSTDFKEIYQIFSLQSAKEQSSRCVQCANPFCHNACPLHNYIPFWLLNTANLNLEMAFKLSNETNPFPEITGRVCPQDRLCEGACTLNDNFGAITIGSIETFITESGLNSGFNPFGDIVFTDKKVAIIGSGPAGLSVATYLIRNGVRVEIYEANHRAGGLLAYGIPGFKIEKSVIERRINILKTAGCVIHTNSFVDDFKFESLMSEFDAVVLAYGARTGRAVGLANEKAKGVYNALDFLTILQKEQYKESDTSIDLNGKKVVVIGGGDTAMDCLRSAIRKGALSATCVYRRDLASMPGSKKEFVNATEEGANFIFNAAPKDIVVNDENKVIALNISKTLTKDGKVELLKGGETIINADIIILALGFDVENLGFLSANGIEFDKKGRVATDKEFRTSKSGVYACGDCNRGSDLVVTAAADAKHCAKTILKDLGL
ncbi:glutamate synthase subunit beta [Campylobacter fetus]|uniref:Glutamate synthase subunit beta n=1 Tax=Campylobacter fetus TaxID=196 RepID=A0A5L8QTD6_CAMFE|nr:glutamate synthase subunit beta [Campylobacter fetus]EAI4415290.1 glutamate synthase subunit beta [Campylobacter fetus]EAI5408415.1 glutamate synthase subunit beta [Campylobacter fetus]EAJ0327991.1 glutamate synthase subunit beta [Campylobacter fetus]EAJ1230847.1 glutamate synthase subunit beta [Campylobacter fetus]EAK0416273.1 glutamate synthase subunit beta [Campylobacter fetus]